MSKSNRTLINGPAFGFPLLTITTRFLLYGRFKLFQRRRSWQTDRHICTNTLQQATRRQRTAEQRSLRTRSWLSPTVGRPFWLSGARYFSGYRDEPGLKTSQEAQPGWAAQGIDFVDFYFLLQFSCSEDAGTTGAGLNSRIQIDEHALSHTKVHIKRLPSKHYAERKSFTSNPQQGRMGEQSPQCV